MWKARKGKMWKDRPRLRSPVVSHSESENIFSSFQTKICSSDDICQALQQKSGSARERVLSVIVSAFENSLQRQFAEENYFTVHYLFMKSFKRGSRNEVSLALRALGLLAITVGSRDCAHELLEESFQFLCQALASISEESNKLSVLNCLAIITFVGAENCVEAQRSMQTIWHLIHPKSVSNIILGIKPTSAILAEAVSAWSFLLTTIDGWKIDYYNWRESLSFLSSLLEKEDFSVCIAAGEAVALIYETGSLIKFCGETKSRESSEMAEEDPCREFTSVEGLKDKILNQVRKVATEVGGQGSAKNCLSNKCRLFLDVLEFLETGVCPKKSIEICRGTSPMKISTYSQLIQLNFFRRFLGSAFLKHMQENDLLHDIFDFIPKKEDPVEYKESLFSCEMKTTESVNPRMGKGKARLKAKHMLAQEKKAKKADSPFGESQKRQGRN